jgi:hypothetical protein
MDNTTPVLFLADSAAGSCDTSNVILSAGSDSFERSLLISKRPKGRLLFTPIQCINRHNCTAEQSSLALNYQ